MKHGWCVWLAVGLLSGCEAEPVPFRQIADVQEVMSSILEPAAEVYWDAAGSIIDTLGTTEIRPETPGEWAEVRNAALVIAESGNLLMMPGRARDRGEWMTLAAAMIEAGRVAVAAAAARNPEAVFDAGAEVYYTCAGCHEKYALDIVPPRDVPEG